MGKAVEHYQICVERKWPSGARAQVAVYNGTDAEKMLQALDVFEHTAGSYKFNLDVDRNYDPDCGAFRTYESIYGEPPKTPDEQNFQKAMDAVRQRFGEEAD